MKVVAERAGVAGIEITIASLVDANKVADYSVAKSRFTRDLNATDLFADIVLRFEPVRR
jgi:hypothetical protein